MMVFLRNDFIVLHTILVHYWFGLIKIKCYWIGMQAFSIQRFGTEYESFLLENELKNKKQMQLQLRSLFKLAM